MGVRTVVLGLRNPGERLLLRLRRECEELDIDMLQLQVEFQSVTPHRGAPVQYKRVTPAP